MAAQVAVIPCAEQLSDGDGKTIADANDEAQDQVVDGAGGANRRQRTDAAETAYDDGICQRVKLLEQITFSGLPPVRSFVIVRLFPLYSLFSKMRSLSLRPL